MKHTPGPWDVAPSGYRVMSANRVVEGRTIWGVYICDTANNPKTRTPENAANARLIAAAPDMLAALKELADDDACGDHCSNSCKWCAARAAIAKAEVK